MIAVTSTSVEGTEKSRGRLPTRPRCGVTSTPQHVPFASAHVGRRADRSEAVATPRTSGAADGPHCCAAARASIG